MSVERTPTGDWRVRWRDDSGRNRSQVVGPLKRDALALDQEIKRARRLGTSEQLFQQKKTFNELSTEWWNRHARGRAAKTQKGYAWILDTYLTERFGGQSLGSIRVGQVEEWTADLADDLVGLEARRKALKLLRQILNKAVAWEYITANPAAAVEMPSARRTLVDPPTVEEVERIRARLLREGKRQDAVLVCLMAYAGLRPHEAVGLLWSDIQENSIRVRTMKKIGAKGRTVRLLKPLASDLAAFKLETSRDLMVLTSERGSAWSATTFNNWRRRRFKRIAPGHRPYNLRHTFISLLIAEGASVPEVAKQAGNSPEICLRTYAHLWDEYERAGSADEAIRSARRAIEGESLSGARDAISAAGGV